MKNLTAALIGVGIALVLALALWGAPTWMH